MGATLNAVQMVLYNLGVVASGCAVARAHSPIIVGAFDEGPHIYIYMCLCRRVQVICLYLYTEAYIYIYIFGSAWDGGGALRDTMAPRLLLFEGVAIGA
jgi:hypothetical protein